VHKAVVNRVSLWSNPVIVNTRRYSRIPRGSDVRNALELRYEHFVIFYKCMAIFGNQYKTES